MMTTTVAAAAAAAPGGKAAASATAVASAVVALAMSLWVTRWQSFLRPCGTAEAFPVVGYLAEAAVVGGAAARGSQPGFLRV